MTPEEEEAEACLNDPWRTFWWNGLVWVTNAQRLLRCPRMQKLREDVRVGPPRPSRYYDLKKMIEMDIVGWYMPPIYRDAPAPTKKPAFEAEQFSLI